VKTEFQFQFRLVLTCHLNEQSVHKVQPAHSG